MDEATVNFWYIDGFQKGCGPAAFVKAMTGLQQVTLEGFQPLLISVGHGDAVGAKRADWQDVFHR